MMKKTALTLCLMAIGLGPMATLAQTPNIPAFTKIDANGDGFIVKSEVRAIFDARASAMDADRDNKLAPEELSAALPHMTPRSAIDYVDLMDRDGDNALDLDEVAADIPMIFIMVDADGDGRISEDEYNAAISSIGG